MAPGSDGTLPGDPERVDAVAQRLRGVAEQVGHVRTSITNTEADGWSGPASASFRDTLGELPAKLAKVETSYDQASTALRRYAGELRDAQGRHRDAVRDRASYEAEAANHDRVRRDARRRLLSAQQSQASAMDPATQSHYASRAAQASADASSAERRAEASRDAAAGAQQRADRARGDWESAVERCCSDLGAASHAGIRNGLGTAWERHIERGLIPVVVGAGKDVIDSATELLKDALRSTVAKFASDVLDALTTALAVVGLGLMAVGAIIAITGVGAPVGGVVAALGAWTTVLGSGLSATKLVLDGARMWAGADVDPFDLGVTALSILPGVRPLVKALPVVKATGPAASKLLAQKAEAIRYGTRGYKGWATRYEKVLDHHIEAARPQRLLEVADDVMWTGFEEAWEDGSEALLRLLAPEQSSQPTCPTPLAAHRMGAVTINHPIPAPAPRGPRTSFSAVTVVE